MPEKTYKQAVCLAALNPASPKNAPMYLAISRRNDNTLWGFPGGKVDAGETAEEALIRECNEELGVHLDPGSLTRVHSGVCPGKGEDDTYLVLTYCTNQKLDITQMTPEEGLELTWLSPGQLRSEMSPFAKYNTEAFKGISHYFMLFPWPNALTSIQQMPATLTYAQVHQLQQMFASDAHCKVTVLAGDGHSGYGLYAFYDEYPDEGAVLLEPEGEGPAPEPLITTEASLRFNLSFEKDKVKGLEDEVRELRGLLKTARDSHKKSLLRTKSMAARFFKGEVQDAKQAGLLLMEIETAVTEELVT